MEINNQNYIGVEEKLMEVRAYAAISLGIFVGLDTMYALLKGYVNILVFGIVFFGFFINWLRLGAKSRELSKTFPKKGRFGSSWFRSYKDEYMKFIEHKSIEASFITLVVYLFSFWLAVHLSIVPDLAGKALVVDHVKPALSLAIIIGALTKLYYLKVANDE